jgi:hypothetical protein
MIDGDIDYTIRPDCAELFFFICSKHVRSSAIVRDESQVAINDSYDY